jgi:hypothetical protein
VFVLLAALAILIAFVQVKAVMHENSAEGRAAAAQKVKQEAAKASRQQADLEIDIAEGFVRNRLRDPDSAQFLPSVLVRKSGKSAVCGFVNSRNGFGGKAGNEAFVVTDFHAYLASDGTEANRSLQQFCYR